MTAQFLGVCPCAISISDKAVAGQEAASLYQAGIQNLPWLYRNVQDLSEKRSKANRHGVTCQPSLDID